MPTKLTRLNVSDFLEDKALPTSRFSFTASAAYLDDDSNHTITPPCTPPPSMTPPATPPAVIQPDSTVPPADNETDFSELDMSEDDWSIINEEADEPAFAVSYRDAALSNNNAVVLLSTCSDTRASAPAAPCAAAKPVQRADLILDEERELSKEPGAEARRNLRNKSGRKR